MRYQLSLSKTAGGQANYALRIDNQIVFEQTPLRNSLVAKDIAAEYLAERGLAISADEIFITVEN